MWNNQPPLGTPINKWHPLAQGLVGCWIFNEGGGQKAFDSFGNIPAGTLTNGAIFTQTARGNAVSFDGSNDYIDLGNSSMLGITGPITIIAWVKPTDFAQYNGILAKTTGNLAHPFDYYIVSSGEPAAVGKPRFFRATNLDATNAVTAGVWSHIAVTVTATFTTTHYLNGVPNGSGNTTGTTNATDNCMIGSRSDGATKFKGTIGCVFLYNRGLTHAEIRSHYQNPYQMFQQPLKLAV